MLCDEDRMPSHWRLLSVLCRPCRCQTIPDEDSTMFHDSIQAATFQVETGLFIQMKPCPKTGLLKSEEKILRSRTGQDGPTF